MNTGSLQTFKSDRKTAPMANRSFAQHLDPAVDPKRILALDGGGLRGVLTLGMLREIEAVLRKQHGGDPGFRLCHYFDLIADTSTGAIIAAALSLGMTVDEVHAHYLNLGQVGFKRSLLRWGALRAKFNAAKGPRGPDRRAGRTQAGQRRLPHRSAGSDQASGHRQPVAHLQQPQGALLQGGHQVLAPCDHVQPLRAIRSNPPSRPNVAMTCLRQLG